MLAGVQSVVAAVAAPLAGFGGDGAVPTAVVVTGSAVASLAVVLTLARSRQP